MSILEANIAALNSVGSDIPDRLVDPATAPHLVRKEDGRFRLRIHRTLVGLGLREPAIEAVLSELYTPPEALLIFGIGLGEILEDAMLRWSETPIMAWERDPAVLMLMLSQLDCSEAIHSGRLQILLGSDLVPHCEAYSGTVLFHPLLKLIYWREQEYFEGDSTRPCALITSGTLFVDDLSRSFHNEGYSTWTLDLHTQTQAELARTIECLQPSKMAAINYTNGLAELCARHEIPLLVWEIDPSIEPIKSPEGEIGETHIFSWSRPNMRLWRKAGFESAHYLPLAANPQHRVPLELTRAEQGRFEAEICFVGSSLLGQVAEFRDTLQTAIAEWLWRKGRDPDHAGTLIEAVLMHQRTELRRYVIPELVEGSMPGFLAEMKARKQRFDPIMMLGELAAAERRLSVVASMGDLGIQVWGDPGWRSLSKHGVRFRGSAGHREELTRIYNAASIHIDIGRIYQLDIVTMRVFDVISCGGFVIAERNPAILELFQEGEEIETWVNVEQLKEKCRYYLEHPERAASIAARGRDRLLREHSIGARLRQMLEVSARSG